jgi:dTDP-4-amino-4,6-dideoxygalactose transaminase
VQRHRGPAHRLPGPRPRPGDRLWTSPNTFVASANCGLYCGAEVDFVDTDPLTYNMSVAALEAKLVAAAAATACPRW